MDDQSIDTDSPAKGRDSFRKKAKLIYIQNIPYFIGILLVICLSIPSSICINSPNSDISSNLINSLHSSTYHDVLVASIAVSMPMLLDLIWDTSFATRSSRQGFISRWVLLFGLLGPNVTELSYVIPQNLIQLHWYLMHLQALFVMSAVFGYLYNFGAPIWTLERTSVCLVIAGMSLVLNLLSYNAFSFSGPCGIISEVLFFILFILVAILSYLWFHRVMRRKTTTMLSPDQYCCLVYMFALLALFIGLLFIQFYFGITSNTYIYNLNINVLSSYTSLTAAITSVISGLHSRRSRLEVANTKHTLEMKRVFVRYVSHEIRTPLNTVFLGLKLLQDDMLRRNEDLVMLETVNDIKDSCDIAVNILNDLLTYEKIEGGLLNIDQKLMNAVNFVRSTIKPFTIQARQASVDLTFIDTEDDVNEVLINIDRHKMSQVFRNLVSNGLKFTPKGGKVTVKIELLNKSTSSMSVSMLESEPNPNFIDINMTDKLKHHEWLRIQVTDTGPGIQKENQVKLFREIIQFSPEVLQNGQGSGLGLWISRAIVDLHNGRIGVFSKGDGMGSTFFVDLPIYKAKQEIVNHRITEKPAATLSNGLSSFSTFRSFKILAGNTIGNKSSSESLTTRKSIYNVPASVPDNRVRDWEDEAEFKQRENHSVRRRTNEIAGKFSTAGMSLLVVDDAKTNRKMLCRLLSKQYAFCEEASDGLEAIEKVKQSVTAGNPFNAILMDFVMPNMDGPTATNMIRALGYKGIIIGVTGNALPQDIHTFIQNGADRVLIKPLDVQVFELTMLELLAANSWRLMQRD